MVSEVYNMDCMLYMRTVSDFFFDLAIVDVPYGIGEDGKKNASRDHKAKAKKYIPYSGNDSEAPPPEYFEELKRISHHQIIWGGKPFHQPFTCTCRCELLDCLG